MEAILIGRSTNLSRSQAGNIIADSSYYKEKNGKHIYKDRYSDIFYLVFTDNAVMDTFIVEKYKGQCSC